MAADTLGGYYYGTFSLTGRRLTLPTAAGCAPLLLRLAREVPYSVEQVRSVTLLAEAGRLFVDVTAEIPVERHDLDPDRVAGVDLGVIHPYAVVSHGGQQPAAGLLVSGRALRAEHRMHLADTKPRQRAVAGRAPARGQCGSRRWRHYRQRQRQLETRHRRRIAQAQHEAARAVVDWAVEQRVSTCPDCTVRVPKPRGRVFSCPHCGSSGHRDLVAARNIAARSGVGPPAADPAAVTHRRAGRHLPGAGQSRRDPRRTAWATGQASRAGSGGPPPAPPPSGESLGIHTVAEDQHVRRTANVA